MVYAINLSEPTVFPDLNSKESKNTDFPRETLHIEKLKYKHIRAALKYQEVDQNASSHDDVNGIK